MKAGIHPEYHEINVVMTDGTEFKTRSCMGKPGETLRLDIDPKIHPAWTGQQRIMDTGGQVAKFNKRFAGLGTKRGASLAETRSLPFRKIFDAALATRGGVFYFRGVGGARSGPSGCQVKAGQ